MDDHLISKVWSWLTSNPHIRVERREQGSGTATADTVNLPISTSTPTAALTTQVEHTGHAIPQQTPIKSSATATDSVSLLPRHDAILVAAENLMWQALTGHGVDITRVKPMEFTLLSFIGAAGRSGIPQTELIAQSGQDKRSLPHRTDMLAERGYITKKSWRVKGLSLIHI